jgi:hypothetical protein
MKRLLLSACFLSTTLAGTANEPSATIENDYFTLSIAAGETEGKVITAIPRNERLKKRQSTGPYFLGVRVASTQQFMRKSLWLKSEQTGIPLDVEQMPALEIRLFVADFEYVQVGVYDDQCFSDGWSFVQYFSVSDDGFTLVDPVAERLIAPNKSAEHAEAPKP